MAIHSRGTKIKKSTIEHIIHRLFKFMYTMFLTQYNKEYRDFVKNIMDNFKNYFHIVQGVAKATKISNLFLYIIVFLDSLIKISLFD